jgi:elongation factor G
MTFDPKEFFRETITACIRHVYTHKNQAGSAGEFAEVAIVFAPRVRGEGSAFVSDLPAAALPAAFVAAVEAGVVAQATKGIIHGFPAIDVLATLVDAKYHNVDSTEKTFETAARLCFQEAMPNAGPVVLEPLIDIAILTPPKYLIPITNAVIRYGGASLGRLGGPKETLLTARLGVSAIEDFYAAISNISKNAAKISMAPTDVYGMVQHDGDGPDRPFPGAAARAVA